jgi:2-polyprenyl-3-methyl-5-hydroxy-6-metoxy-1,4-benzoquinol methylase
MLDPEDRVLELGCGSGIGTYFLSQYCKEIRGVDINEEVIEVAKRNSFSACNLQFETCDALKYIPPTTPDTAIAVDLIEHFTKSEGEALIRHVAAYLEESKGMIIIGTPNVYSQDYRSSRSKSQHRYEYSPDEMRHIVSLNFHRTLSFSMNDEIVHTGFSKLAWFLFVLGIGPKTKYRRV